jgi:hypothetical protein
VKFQWPFRRRGEGRDAKRRRDVHAAVLATEFGMSGCARPGSNIDYATEVKNGMYSSVITSALAWMMRTFPEAPVVVQRSKEERWETVAQHALTKLLRKPNPEYGARAVDGDDHGLLLRRSVLAQGAERQRRRSRSCGGFRVR